MLQQTLLDRIDRWHRWTPDFSAGVAELEVEAILTRYHLLHRASLVASGALQVLARPEDVVRRGAAWGALGLEAVTTACAWRRTRRWESMLAPEIAALDAAGAVTVTLESRAVTTAAQATGFMWTNQNLIVRGAAAPLTSERGVDRLVALATVLAPHVLWPPERGDRAPLRHIAPRLALATATSLATATVLRRQAARIDARAAADAADAARAVVDRERTDFEDEVLAPAVLALRAAAALVYDEPETARAIAAQEEERLRGWLRRNDERLDEPFPIDTAAQVAATVDRVERLTHQVRAGVRAGTSLLAWWELRRSPGRTTVPAIANGLRLTTSIAAMAAPSPRRSTPLRSRWALTAVDAATVVTASAYERRHAADRRVRGWVDELSYGVAATPATAGRDGAAASATSATSTLVGAIRVGVALTRRAPWPQRVAGAANEALLLGSTAWLVRGTVASIVERVRHLTEASTEHAAALHDRELRERRLHQHGLVHDGPAQVCHAVAAGIVEGRRAATWLEAEAARIDAVLAGAPTPSRSIDEALGELAGEFQREGLTVVVDCGPMPEWSRRLGEPVLRIVREGLRNVHKHTDSVSAWVGGLDKGDGVVVTVLDFSSDPNPFVPGTGTGTRTMLALARVIDAELSWMHTPAGGTEMRLEIPRR